jgi:hypothetical protein
MKRNNNSLTKNEILVFWNLLVTTLALGLRSRQGLAKVWVKNEVRESHFMLLGVWESVRE